MRNRVLFALPALLLTGTLPGQPAQKTARADILNAKGEKNGSTTLREEKERTQPIGIVTPRGEKIKMESGTLHFAGGVRIKLNASQLPAGTHALHIHAVGKCDPPDFKTAGPHFNPTGKKHGRENPEGAHAGDLPNFEVGNDGRAKVSLFANHVTLDDGPNSLFHPEGTALVIHEKPDDYITDPTGNAGARIACGVIQK